MRRTLLALAALAAMPAACASDLTGLIIERVLQKVPATMTLRLPASGEQPSDTAWVLRTDAQAQVWLKPPGMQAAAMMFYYFYGLSPDHWVVMIDRPLSPTGDYLGTSRLRLLGTELVSGQPFQIFQIQGGRFSGYLAAERATDGRRRIMLFTPAMIARSPKLKKYLN